MVARNLSEHKTWWPIIVLARRIFKIDPLVWENVQSNENLVNYYAKC